MVNNNDSSLTITVVKMPAGKVLNAKATFPSPLNVSFHFILSIIPWGVWCYYPQLPNEAEINRGEGDCQGHQAMDSEPNLYDFRTQAVDHFTLKYITCNDFAGRQV